MGVFWFIRRWWPGLLVGGIVVVFFGLTFLFGFGRMIDARNRQYSNMNYILKESTTYLEDYYEKNHQLPRMIPGIQDSYQFGVVDANDKHSNHTMISIDISDNKSYPNFRSFAYYQKDNKFLIYLTGPDRDFEDHPSTWFTAETTMTSPEITKRKVTNSFFGGRQGDVYFIGEYK